MMATGTGRRKTTEEDRVENVEDFIETFNEGGLKRPSKDSIISGLSSASGVSDVSEASSSQSGRGSGESFESLRSQQKEGDARLAMNLASRGRIDFERDEVVEEGNRERPFEEGKLILRSTYLLKQNRDVNDPRNLDYTVGFYRPANNYCARRAELLGHGKVKEAQLCEGDWVRRMLYYVRKKNLWPPKQWAGMFISSGYYYDYYLQKGGTEIPGDHLIEDDVKKPVEEDEQTEDESGKDRKKKWKKIRKAPIKFSYGDRYEVEFIRIPKSSRVVENDGDNEGDGGGNEGDGGEKQGRKSNPPERVRSFINKLEEAEEDTWENEEDKETDLIANVVATDNVTDEVLDNDKPQDDKPKKTKKRQKHKQHKKHKKQKKTHLIEISDFEQLDFTEFSNNRVMISGLPSKTGAADLEALIGGKKRGRVEAFFGGEGRALLLFDSQKDAAKYFNSHKNTKIGGKYVELRPVLISEI